MKIRRIKRKSEKSDKRKSNKSNIRMNLQAEKTPRKKIKFRKSNKVKNTKNSNFKIKGAKALRLFIIAVLLIVYIPIMFNWLFGSGVKTDFLRTGTLDERVETKGVFVRNEAVMMSSLSGKCISEPVLGEKVAKDQQIGKIVNSDSEKFIEDVKVIENKMLQIINEDPSVNSFNSEDIVKIDGQIGSKLKSISMMSMKNSVEGSEKVYSEVNELIKKKIDIITNSNYAESEQLKILKKQKDELVKKSQTDTTVLKADSAGIISYLIDGYEKKLTFENMKGINFKEFEKIKDVQNERIDFSSFNVNKNEPYAKIITDVDIYIVCFLNENQAKMFKIGDEIDINVVNINKKLNSYVESLEKESNKYKAVFKTNEAISEICTIRKADLEISSVSEEGFKVPLKALKNIDKSKNEAKIVLNKGNCASMRDVRIIAMGKEYAIIGNREEVTGQGITFYDEYLVNPNNIEEGQLIKFGN